MKGNRLPAVAGMFYPADKQKLLDTINSLMSRVPAFEPKRHIYGIVAPHAGYLYSGYTAATAFNAVSKKSYKRVVILSPSHYDSFAGCSIYDGESFETPLGKVPIDKNFAEELVEKTDSIFFSQRGHRKEHGIEVELPFLQYIWNDFSFVPLVMGSQDSVTITGLADALVKTAVNESTLIITSTDLSHFYSREEANKLDAEVAKEIELMDSENLLKKLNSGKAQACGGGPLVSHLRAMKSNEGISAKVLYRIDSSEASGDFNSVVGYLSAVIYE